MHRHPVNKRKSAHHFKQQVKHTKAPNVSAPMRGGWRL